MTVMALYLLALDAGPLLVRARNGARAAEIAGGCHAIHRVTEDGPEGVVGVAERSDAPDRPRREPIDVTDLSDRDQRRYLDPSNGEVFTVPRVGPPLTEG